MFEHSFKYSIFEEYVEIDNSIIKEIKKIKLKKDQNIPNMNLNSFYEVNKSFDNLIEKKLNHIFKKYKLKLDNCWIQKYLKNSYHNLHTHGVENKSFVWFIEGSKKSSPLCFYDVSYPIINTKQSFKFKFIPGTLIIFPGFIPHEVKPNKDNKRLIVSGNVI